MVFGVLQWLRYSLSYMLLNDFVLWEKICEVRCEVFLLFVVKDWMFFKLFQILLGNRIFILKQHLTINRFNFS